MVDDTCFFVLQEISHTNLEAILKEAELEEEEEGRSRNAAFIAAAAAAANPRKTTPNPLAFVAESNNEGNGDEGSIGNMAAESSTASGAGQRSAHSTPRDESEEMVEFRPSLPAGEVVNTAAQDTKGQTTPWFSRRDSDILISPVANHLDEEGAEDAGVAASGGDQDIPPSRSGSHSDASGEGAATEVLRRKQYYNQAEPRWTPEEVPLAEGTSGEATTPENRDGTATPDAEEARNSLMDIRLASQEPESDEDGYELLEISNADRRGSPGEGNTGRNGGAGASCTSSAFVEYDRDAAREREGSFIDTLTLWLGGR